MNNFITTVSNIINKKLQPVKSVNFLVEIPQKGMTDKVIDATIEEINYILERLTTKIHFETTLNIERPKNLATQEAIQFLIDNIQEPSITFITREFNEYPNKNQNNIIAISFSESVTFPGKEKGEDYILSARWYPLNPKRFSKKQEITKLVEICSGDYKSQLETGIIKNKSNKDLIELLSLGVEHKLLKGSSLPHITGYLVGKELIKRIKKISPEPKNFELDKFFDEDDLYFSQSLTPFNFKNKSYIINEISGQGETFFDLKELPEHIEDFPTLER